MARIILVPERYLLGVTRDLERFDRGLFARAKPAEARRVLERAFAQGSLRDKLLAFCAEQGAALGDGRALSARSAREWLIAALDRPGSRVRLLHRRTPEVSGPIEFPAPFLPPAPQTPPPPLSWLELEVLYTDDEGALGMAYSVDMPGQSPKTGKLDRYGYAYLTDIPPGSYKVVFGAAQGEPPEELRGWLDLELADRWGQPIAGAAYEITLPDQRVLRGTLDQNGRAHVAGIPEGDCKVVFPELDSSFVSASESA
jgi:hypothetical protein